MPFAGYTDFKDCVAKNKDKGDPEAYCGSIQSKVEEANRIYAKEQTPEQVASLTTPDAEDVQTEEPKDLIAPQGSSKETEDDKDKKRDADYTDDKGTKYDFEIRKKPYGGKEVSPDSEIITNDKYGKLNGNKYTKNEQDQKDDKREEQQSLEYNGETYHKVKAIEYEDEIYVQKDDKEEAEEDDVEFEDDIYKKADDDTLELENDNDYFIKDEEQAPLGDIGQPTPETAMDIPALNPTMESVVIRESNGKYKKYNVFEADNPVQTGNTDDYEVDVDEYIKTGEPTQKLPTDRRSYDTKASDEMKAVERIIIKEKGKLKFKSVFTEVKKKA